jgi:hypothetical protein
MKCYHDGITVQPVTSATQAYTKINAITFFQTLSAADLRDPEISALVASKLREFHNLDMPGPKSVLIWDRLK